MSERIGVYVCECGPNIKDAVHIEELLSFAGGLDGVVVAKPFRLLCSEEGQSLIVQDIKEYSLSRIVIAACSPKEHEHTFKNALRQAGLNPYFLQIANIREQCAWVIKDKQRATDQAKVMVRAAVQRVVLHEPLEAQEISVNPDVLVIGAGIAGMSAALTLAQKQRTVYLVEQSPCIGGKVTRYEDVFPNLECAPCMLEPKMDEVMHNERIKLLTLSTVKEVLGFYGNFVVTVQQKARCVDSQSCIGCGACFDVCPVSVKNEFNESLNERKAVFLAYPGALPNVASIDKARCLRFAGKECSACEAACPFGAIKYDEPDQMHQLRVGAIVVATGFELFDVRTIGSLGYGSIDHVYTSLEFERLISSTGPTAGKLVLKNGAPPAAIALLHCVGSRTKEHREYCSGVCCSYLFKFAQLAAHKVPGVKLVDVYSDLCLPGKKTQQFFNTAVAGGSISFIRTQDPNAVVLEKDGERIALTVDGQKTVVDMVVLAPAMEGGAGASALAALLDISVDQSRFFNEEHDAIAPVSTTAEGIFVAGCARGPADIAASVAQAQAAAGKVLATLVPGEKRALDPATAEVNEDACSGCKTCIGVCAYNAISYDQAKKHASVNQVLCRGCGVCVATCPSGAIVGKHFTDRQIAAEINGILK